VDGQKTSAHRDESDRELARSLALADIAMARSGAPSVVCFGSRRTAGR
jgi:hypothetical protein